MKNNIFKLYVILKLLEFKKLPSSFYGLETYSKKYNHDKSLIEIDFFLNGVITITLKNNGIIDSIDTIDINDVIKLFNTKFSKELRQHKIEKLLLNE